MIQTKSLAFAAAITALWTTQSPADWTQARCDIYPRGSDHTDKMIPCTFGQRQGAVSITRAGGVAHELSPVGGEPGHFRDQQGRPVFGRTVSATPVRSTVSRTRASTCTGTPLP